MNHPAIAEALFETPHMLVAILDGDLRFVRVNTRYAEACGMSPAELVGLSLPELAPHEVYEAAFRRVIETGIPYGEKALPFRQPNEPESPETFWDCTATALYGPNGRRDGLLVQLVDVTDHVVVQGLAEERLLLLRELNHRVTNNFQIVASLLSDVARQHPVLAPAVHRSIGRVRSIARIHDLLTGGHLGSNVDIARYASAIASDLGELHARPDICVTVTGSAFAPVEVASPVGMILQELISNAYQHAFPDGRAGLIDVHVRESGNGFEVEICDDGVGLSRSDRGSEDTFGMSVVHGLTEQVRGTLLAHAVSPKGTCCTLIVPLERRSRSD